MNELKYYSKTKNNFGFFAVLDKVKVHLNALELLDECGPFLAHLRLPLNVKYDA